MQNKVYWQLFILLVTLVFYLPSFSLGFVNWDDDIYIFANPFINSLSASNIGHIFSRFFHGNYHPLTMLSYAIEHAIAGEIPFVYHLTNVILHLANTYLVFVFVQKLIGLIRKDNSKSAGLIIAAITSVLFGVHPLHVESVSWVSERKDVLYTFFFIIALVSYLRYIETPKLKGYLLTLFVFILSLLSKGMAVSFSVTIIAIDYVLRRDFLSKKVIVEKIPFLIVSAIFGFIAIKAQKDLDAIIADDVYSFLDKLAFSTYGLSQYFLKLFVPVNLCHYYPYPVMVNGSFPLVYYILPLVILSIITGLIFVFRKSRLVMFGFLFFLVNIFLVLKFIQVGGVIMADRYTYLASIGVFFAIALFFEYVLSPEGRQLEKPTFIKPESMSKISIIALLVYVLFLGIQTNQRTKVWTDSLSLWSDADAKYPQNPTILLNKAAAHLLNNDVESALKDYKQSMSLDPNNYKVYTNVGNIELSRGHFEQSIEHYSKSLGLNADNEKAYCGRGQAFINIGRLNEATTDLNKAISLNPSYADAYRYRGTIKYLKKEYLEAIKDFNILIKLNPYYPEAYFGRGLCYLSLNNRELACKDLNKAANLNYKPAFGLINSKCK